MEFLINLKKILKPFSKQAVGLLAAMLFFELLKLVNPYLLKEILDSLIAWKPELITRALYLILGMFVVEGITMGSSFFIDRFKFDFVVGIERYLFHQAHKKLLSLSLAYHEKENTGSKIIRIQRGIDKLVELFDGGLWDFGPIIFQIIVTLVFFLIFDWQLALVFVFIMPFFLAVTLRMNFLARPWREKTNQAYEESAGLITQNIINIKTVQSFAQEERSIKDHNSVLDKVYSSQGRSFGIFLRGNLFRGIMINVSRLLFLSFGVYQTYTGSITPGSLVMLITLSEKVYTSMFRLSRIYDRIMDSVETAKRLAQLLDEDLLVSNKANAVKLKEFKGEVEFKHVDFSYDGANPALKNVSFKINQGETIAIVGPSGSGKTTLVKLLYRHFDVSRGEILIDGRNLKDLDLVYYRQRLGIVTQDIDIFSDSVKNNIAYAKPDAKMADIERAAQIAYADKFITRFKRGYETRVGERGVKLSGGQKQRVGIARAVLVDPKILIFDEATSSLDSESEKYIQLAIKRMAGRATMIIIAHRLSTVYQADKILVLDQGQLVEFGSHQQLREKGGLYAKLLHLQTIKELL